MKPNKKGIMAENFFSQNQNLIFKQYEKNLVVLWIIGILRVLAEIEFKFSNIQYWDTINEQLISINLESNSIEIVQCQIKKKSYEIYFLPIFSTKLPINTT